MHQSKSNFFLKKKLKLISFFLSIRTKIDLTRYTEKHTFTFDDVFDGSSSSEHIYSRTAQPLVEYVFNGGKATCFAQ